MLGTVGAASLAPVLLKAGEAERVAITLPQMPSARPVLAADLAVGPVLQHGNALRTAGITGGQVHGALSGTVQGGRIEWQPRPDGSCEMSVRFHVQGPDAPVEICERAILAAGDGLQGCWAASATTESLATEDPASGAALLVGRVDTRQLQQGVVKLLAFEVA